MTRNARSKEFQDNSEHESMIMMNNQKIFQIQLEFQGDKVSMVFQTELLEEICTARNSPSKGFQHILEYESMPMMNNQKILLIQFDKVSMAFHTELLKRFA
jgi:hypothetical protein